MIPGPASLRWRSVRPPPWAGLLLALAALLLGGRVLPPASAQADPAGPQARPAVAEAAPAGPEGLAQGAGGALRTVTAALAVEGDGPRFPATAIALPVALPDDWARTRPGYAGPVWYRVTLDLSAAPADGTPLVLYAPRVCADVELQVNGQRLTAGTRGEPPRISRCRHPQQWTLPSALLQPGRNEIDLRVSGHPLAEIGSRQRAAGLSSLVIGPASAVAPLHARHTAWSVTLPQALGAALLLTGGFMFVLGFVDRRESRLAYFGVVSVTWAALDARLWLPTWPLDHRVVEFVGSSLLAVLALAAVQFMLRSAKWRHRGIDIALPVQCLLMPMTLLLAGPARLYPMTGFWSALFALEVAAASAFALQRLRASGHASVALMGALITLAALGAVSLLAAQRFATPPLLPPLAHAAVATLLVLAGLQLVRRQGEALRAAELGRAQLELRIREATQEIERNFRQLSDLRVEQVTERERKRIAGDLHDDLGAKLLTIVHTSESEQISTLAREALEEMRLSVRGLDGRPVGLADALADWRAEVMQRLTQAGIEVEWTADDDLPERLSARAFVQTTRILREATSNVIKHSGATRCTVRCRLADGELQLMVQDNGQGIAMDLDGRLDRGHGMASMKSRARQMRGQCLVESVSGQGTVIRLTLPLDQALESA